MIYDLEATEIRRLRDRRVVYEFKFQRYQEQGDFISEGKVKVCLFTFCLIEAPKRRGVNYFLGLHWATPQGKKSHFTG